MKDTFFIILAGGSGERLWPLSSYLRPKQLIPFVGGTSLLEQTIQRIQPLVKNKNYVWISTNADLQDPVKKIVGKQASVLAEPIGRNTAPAVLLSCLEVYEKDEDAVIVVLPSDHFIPESDQFVSLLWAAVAFASCHDHIVLLGIKPTTASTGFGYIQYNHENFAPGWQCHTVKKFHEKPDKDVAKEYLASDDMLWNIGIFVGSVRTFIGQFKEHAPELYEAMVAYRASSTGYENLPSISLDHAILEKSNKVVVFPASFAWHDVGTLPAFLTLKAQYEKDSATQIVNIDASNNLACSTKKVVAFVGVKDVCLVETDEAILVVAQERVEAVREVSSVVRERRKQHAEKSEPKVETTASL